MSYHDFYLNSFWNNFQSNLHNLVITKMKTQVESVFSLKAFKKSRQAVYKGIMLNEQICNSKNNIHNGYFLLWLAACYHKECCSTILLLCNGPRSHLEVITEIKDALRNIKFSAVCQPKERLVQKLSQVQMVDNGNI